VGGRRPVSERPSQLSASSMSALTVQRPCLERESGSHLDHIDAGSPQKGIVRSWPAGYRLGDEIVLRRRQLERVLCHVCSRSREPRRGQSAVAELSTAHTGRLLKDDAGLPRPGPSEPSARVSAGRLPTAQLASVGPSRCSSAARGSAPTIRSTSRPLRITTRSGIDLAPKRAASPGLASTSTLTTFSRPASRWRDPRARARSFGTVRTTRPRSQRRRAPTRSSRHRTSARRRR